MKQDDYFLKQIDVLGRILGKIISDLLKLKNSEDVMGSIELTNHALKNELDFNLNDMLLLDNKELVNFLKVKMKFNNSHLELFAEILYTLGFDQISSNKMNILEKSLVIYDYLNKNSDTYSLQRIAKMDKISKFLSM
jgi:hypothetical protein